MRDVDVMVRYKWLMEEAWTLTKQAERVIRIGSPAGISIQAITGMPHGTNDKDAAAIQAFDGYAAQLKEKANKLLEICGRFEHVLSLLKDDRQRDICRKYYALSMTDEQIGKKLHMDQANVNRIRNDALEKLHKIS